MSQVKSLLALESFVLLAARGLDPISKTRLEAEAKTFGWVAVRAHALEWFDSLPARAFEAHALLPMSVSLLPQFRNEIGVNIIRNSTLHTPSPLIHEWAVQHRFFEKYFVHLSILTLKRLQPAFGRCFCSVRHGKIKLGSRRVSQFVL